MERIIRSLFQLSSAPEAEEAYKNWLKVQEYQIGFPLEEDRKIMEYINGFYNDMQAPPDYSLMKEYFESKDEAEVISRLSEIKAAQFYIQSNYLALIRQHHEEQQLKSFIHACKEASNIAEHGRNLEKPINGKKTIRGVQDAVGYFYDKMSEFLRVESGEKLEGSISEEAEEVIDEYETTEKNKKFADRNLFGLEPVDSVCKGHKRGEYWVHCAFSGELKCLPGDAEIYDHNTQKRRRISEIFRSGDLPRVTALFREGKEKRLVQADASHVVENGVREVFTMRLRSGREVSATSNHPFFTNNGWKNLGDLKIGDNVGVPRGMKAESPRTNFSDLEVADAGYKISITSDGIPDEFFGLSENQIRILIGSLWSAGGSINTKVHSHKSGKPAQVFIKFDTASHQLARDVQSTLLRLSIQSRIQEHWLNHKNHPHRVFSVLIDGDFYKGVFLREVRIAGKEEEQERAIQVLCAKNTKRVKSELISDETYIKLANERRHFINRTKVHKTETRSALQEFWGYDSEEASADGELFWDPIISIQSRGFEMTYDLSVPEHHSFVVNDVVSHNSTVALNYAYNNAYVYQRNIFYAMLEMQYKAVRRQLYVIHSSHGKFVTEWAEEDRRKGRPEIYTGIHYRKVRDGELTDLEKKRFQLVAQDFKANCKGKIHIWKPEVEASMQDIKRKSEIFHNKHRCDGLIIDYLGLVKSTQRTTETVDRINRVITEGRLLALNFARGTGVPLLALFQMNRQGKLRADKNDGKYDFAAISYANQCVASNTIVKTDRGWIHVQDVNPGSDLVWSRTGWKPVLNKFDNGKRDVYKLITDRGHSIRVTDNHRLRIFENGELIWKETKDINVGDWTISGIDNAKFPHGYQETPPLVRISGERLRNQKGEILSVPDMMTDELAYLMGAHDGDGIWVPSRSRFGWCGNSKETILRDKIDRFSQNVFGQWFALSSPRESEFRLIKNSKSLARWCGEIGMDRSPGVPDIIMRSHRSAVVSYLQGLWDTDGSINRQGVLSLTQKNSHRKTLEDVQILLSDFGIESTLKSRSQKSGDRVFERCDLRILSRESRKLFGELIGFTEPEKQKKLLSFIEGVRSSNTFGNGTHWPVMIQFKQLFEKYEKRVSFTRKVKHAVKNCNTVPAGALHSMINTLDEASVADSTLAYLKSLLSTCVPVKVESITHDGMDNVWDLEVTGDHEYVTAGFFSHNCEKDADVITYTYLNDLLRKEGKYYLGCIKNRDNPHFEQMVGKIIWHSKRMRAIESGVLSLDTEEKMMKASEEVMHPDMIIT